MSLNAIRTMTSRHNERLIIIAHVKKASISRSSTG